MTQTIPDPPAPASAPADAPIAVTASSAPRAATSAYPDGLPVPRRYWAIAAIILAIAMSVLDTSVANIALPSIAREFHVSNAASIWVINGYQMAVLALLLPLASLGEIVGYRRVSQVGLVVFTIASLACACSHSLLQLVLARVLQGLGASAIMSVNVALVRFTYPQAMLGRAVGINALAVAISSAVGPTVASAILSVGSWPWLFAINVPLGVVTFLIAVRAQPENPTVSRPPNYVGAALNAATFILLIAGLQSFAHGSADSVAIAQVVAGVAFGAALVRHELNRPSPIVPFDLLRIRVFSLSVAVAVASFAAAMAGLVSLPFEIQRLGHSAVETGLLMTPWPLGAALGAPIAGRLADRYPAGILGSAGLVSLTCGLVLLALLPAGFGPWDLVWRMALCGVGFGFFQAPNNRTLLAAAPRARSGAAGGMLSTGRLLGQTLGAGLVALVFRALPDTGSNRVLWIAAGIALTAAVISVTRLRPGRGTP